MRSLHAVVGALVCVVLPGASYFDGTGRLAYGMFSWVREYRLEVRAIDGLGREHAVAPMELGQATGGSSAQFFAGIEGYRRGPVTLMPRARLSAIAALACSVSGFASVRVTLFERPTVDGPIATTSDRRDCSGP